MSRTLCRPVRWMVAATVAAVLAGGCSSGDDGNAGKAGAAGTAAAGAESRITDAKGKEVAPARTPERVVCLVALCDDMLTELDIVPVATNSKLLAHPQFLGPEKVKEVATVPGGFVSPEVESILSFRPDLVIGLEDTHGKLAPALKGATAFWALQPASWQDSVAYLHDLGRLTGRQAQAAAAEQRFRAKLDAAKAAKRADTALVIFGSDENFGVAMDGQDIAGSMIAEFADYPWPSRGIEGTYSLEEILTRDVDVLFVETLSFGGAGEAKLSEKLAANPLWQRIPAVRDNRVVEVDAEVWAKGRGTRSLGIVIDEATAALR
ncbi:ABC transporter substrate-binding protein [Yinghuangia sp. YIM S10712]|uniref:ABC transporter substrate-binding protein n=1 Tax=Yinghuangia sp. YIM S10712 TaxID=3436930 RepID=UPI003F532302